MINRLNIKSKQKIIRLRIRGRKFYPIFDIIVINKCSRNRGRIIEKLGFINPNFNERLLFINTFRLSFWLNKGILINNTVKKYLLKFVQIKIK